MNCMYRNWKINECIFKLDLKAKLYESQKIEIAIYIIQIISYEFCRNCVTLAIGLPRKEIL
jgi:hypothetical protein